MSLQCQDLYFGFQYPLLDTPLNVQFHTSNLYVIFGNNGCGKTSFIKTIARLYKALSGKILYEKIDIFQMNKQSFAKTLSFLLTTRPFLMHHTIFDIIALGRIPYSEWHGKLSSSDHEIILHYAQLFQIEPILEKPAHQVSDGQLQKALIAKTLAQQTPILILDEPLSYLDYGTKKYLLRVLKTIAHKENKLIVLSSHDVTMSTEFADAILLIHQKKYAFDTAQNIQQYPLFHQFLNVEV